MSVAPALYTTIHKQCLKKAICYLRERGSVFTNDCLAPTEAHFGGMRLSQRILMIQIINQPTLMAWGGNVTDSS